MLNNNKSVSSLERGLKWVLPCVSSCDEWIFCETLLNTPLKSPQGDKRILKWVCNDLYEFYAI